MIRLLEAPYGSISLNGHDLHDIPLSTSGQTVSLIPQEPFLFSDTIRANLLLARPEAKEEEMLAVLQAAPFTTRSRPFPRGWIPWWEKKGSCFPAGKNSGFPWPGPC